MNPGLPGCLCPACRAARVATREFTGVRVAVSDVDRYEGKIIRAAKRMVRAHELESRLVSLVKHLSALFDLVTAAKDLRDAERRLKLDVRARMEADRPSATADVDATDECRVHGCQTSWAECQRSGCSKREGASKMPPYHGVR